MLERVLLEGFQFVRSSLKSRERDVDVHVVIDIHGVLVLGVNVEQLDVYVEQLEILDVDIGLVLGRS